MTPFEITGQRLQQQLLAGNSFDMPEAVVQWQGAVQSQDYAGAKWGLGLRLKSATDEIIEEAFTNGTILRTHVLRPTWHFVAPADIRWMLMLTAPRVNALNAYQYRNCELDEATFTRSFNVLERALQGGKHLTRDELRIEFQQAGIDTSDLRMTHLMMRAELDGIVCSGARRGKQFTYALLEERVAPAKSYTRDEALIELATRYFSSRGPATLQDFVWWSGLSMTDAKRGIEVVKTKFVSQVIDGQTYWLSDSAAGLPAKKNPTTAHLLPNYDEYFIGFKDRSALTLSLQSLQKDVLLTGLSAHIIVLDGQLVGGWKRTLKKNAVELELSPLRPLSKNEQVAVKRAAEQYRKFLQLPVNLTWHNNQTEA
ncbi:MAG: AlkZ family DNA glycosylase [Acidobacteria bacterium]|nr:AlkZ family DNA glycosylase [Acidobacteriota bacterium]